jgi:ribosomal protein L31
MKPPRTPNASRSTARARDAVVNASVRQVAGSAASGSDSGPQRVCIFCGEKHVQSARASLGPIHLDICGDCHDGVVGVVNLVDQAKRLAARFGGPQRRRRAERVVVRPVPPRKTEP